MYPVVAVTAIFAVTYYFIVTERINRTTVALAGALAVLLLPGLALTQEEAVGFIDFNTLGLLVGMMLIVAVLKRTGVFRYLALKVAQQGRGRVFLIFAGFGAITAVASAFIDNVTTVLMIPRTNMRPLRTVRYLTPTRGRVKTQPLTHTWYAPKQ